jgi:hypothetical protein
VTAPRDVASPWLTAAEVLTSIDAYVDDQAAPVALARRRIG